jgi:hypothetical protein
MNLKNVKQVYMKSEISKPLKRNGNRQFTDEEIAKALTKHKGLQYLASDDLGISYGHMSARISASEYLQQVRADAREKRIDMAEKSLTDMVEMQELGAVIYTLKTLGKSRGYIESIEQTVDKETINAFLSTMKMISEAQNKD